MTSSLSDADRLLRGYVEVVAQAPFRLVPERNEEMTTKVFGGEQWNIFFVSPQGARQQGFFARPNEKQFTVTAAALLSLWALSHAALTLASEGALAVRKGERQLAVSEGTPAADALALVQASKNALLHPDDPWPSDLPVPEPNAVSGTPGEAVNNVFLAAVGWVLLHEIAHVHLKHDEVTTDALVLRQEEEADEWASEMALAAAGAKEREFRIFAVGTALAWLGVWDAAAGTAASHPHPSRRLLAASVHFDAPDASPGLEMVTYVLKALFDPSAEVPDRETVGEAFDDVAWAYLRSSRQTP